MLAKALSAATAAAAEKVYVEDVFSTYLYTGNGSTQTVTNGIDLAGEGGMVWCKRRDAGSHGIFDTERGIYKTLYPNYTYGQDNLTTTVTAFNSDGFSTGAHAIVNASSINYASWTFRKAPGFFDVVTYTGTGSTQNISHNLGSVPGVIIIKPTTFSDNWIVYHRSLGNNRNLKLNLTDSSGGASEFAYTSPTSSVFTVSSDSGVNASGHTFVAYLFAHDEQIFGENGNESVIQCGTYTGDSSGNATVNLGWEPQWVLFKRSDAAQTWAIADNMRGMTTSSNAHLYPNTTGAEYNNANFYVAPTATGFQAKTTASATYIYIAIRRGPMKTPTDATKVFKANTYTGNGSLLSVTGIGFPPDFSFTTRRDTASWVTTDKLRGATKSLYAQSTDAEVDQGIYEVRSYDQDGITYGQNSIVNGSSAPLVHHLFRRAPGFFDVVAFTGAFASTAYDHNLGVTPEMIIVKKRSGTSNWLVYQDGYPTPTTNQGALDLSNGSLANSNFPTAHTSTQFTVRYLDNGGTYVAYLFATLSGVSKVGSYTGTGTTKQIDCGFAAGASYVVIKRTDSSGDWYVWDTARGIISGNDPYLRLNSTGAEVTTTDYIDPYSAGFEISSSAPAAINASGGNFIFLAIA